MPALVVDSRGSDWQTISRTGAHWCPRTVSLTAGKDREPTEPLMPRLEQALARAKAFADSWTEDDLIDEESGLTAADLRLVVAAAEAGRRLAELPTS